MPQQPIDYTTRYQIRSGRVNFANYVKRRQLIQDGVLIGLNILPPDNDASIVPIIQEGAVSTTPAELAAYLGETVETPVVPPTPPATVPGAPTAVSATAGNAQATVSFTAPTNDGGATITAYMVTSSPDGFTATGSASPLTVTGLTNGTAYTFTVVATNSVGDSAPSSASSAVTPATVPDAPTAVNAVRGNAQATVSFTAPTNDGGVTITGYTVTSSPGGFTATGSASPLTVTGLTNGTAYTFTVVATNSVGNSVASSASSPVTPAVPGDAIAASLTTSLAAYNAAATDDWVPITSTEYVSLQTNITGTTKVGVVDSYLTGAIGTNASGLSQSKAALVSNTVTAQSLAIPANNYVYGFAFRYVTTTPSAGMLVYTNTNISSTGGYNQVGNTLPSVSTVGISYFVRKGVSSTNGGTAGLLGFFTGTKMDYSGSFFGSGGYIGFNNYSSPTPPTMRYLLNDGTVPTSPSTLTGGLPGYGTFQIQGLTTATIQW
jgi:hypothetical protein